MLHKPASEYPQELLELLNRYVHGEIDRRGFLDGAGKFATASMTAAMLFEALRPNYALAEQVKKDDPRIKVEYVTIPSPAGNGSVRGPLARPANAQGKLPSVLVVHENRGLTPHIEDVGRRLALAGYMSFAPDGLTSLGGYPGNDEKGAEMFQKVDRQKMLEDFLAAARWLKGRPDATGKLGATGFCFGGGVVNSLAVKLGGDIQAVAPFYGGQPPAAEVSKIKAAVLAHYGGLDERVNAGWPAFEAALKANHVTYAGFIYEGANHGFHNDTTPRYDEKAAKLAWQRTMELFQKHLN